MIEPVGTQLWADMRWRDGWRVQRRWNREAGRLLDPRGRTIHRGSVAECQRALERLAPAPVAADHLVVLLHGLGRTRRSLARLDRALTRSGFATARLDYPSTRATIEEHAAQVADLLDHVPTPAALSFVGHSLGALVSRQLFAHQGTWRSCVARVAMLAPPNQGASIASLLDGGGILRTVLGPSFAQIASGRGTDLPVPDVPVAVFAGDAFGTSGDGLVEVEETRLPSAVEHHTIPAIHTFIMNRPEVIRGVVSFLRGAPDRR